MPKFSSLELFDFDKRIMSDRRRMIFLRNSFYKFQGDSNSLVKMYKFKLKEISCKGFFLEMGQSADPS